MIIDGALKSPDLNDVVVVVMERIADGTHRFDTGRARARKTGRYLLNAARRVTLTNPRITWSGPYKIRVPRPTSRVWQLRNPELSTPRT
jgi:hypothetical protein